MAQQSAKFQFQILLTREQTIRKPLQIELTAVGFPSQAALDLCHRLVIQATIHSLCSTLQLFQRSFERAFGTTSKTFE